MTVFNFDFIYIYFFIIEGDGIPKDQEQADAFKTRADELKKEADSGVGINFGEQHK